MKCAICQHGKTNPGMTTIVLEKGQAILVYKRVPAEVCDNCGETYLSSETNHALLQYAKKEVHRGVRVT